jgi:transcriptional regulator with XRE-family HTH domain
MEDEAQLLLLAFGEVARAVREANGWTEEAVAERAGISPGLLREIEGGRADADPFSFARLARSGLRRQFSDLVVAAEAVAYDATKGRRRERSSRVRVDRSVLLVYDDSSCIGCGSSTVGRGPVAPRLCPRCRQAPPEVGGRDEPVGLEEQATLKVYFFVLTESERSVVVTRWRTPTPTFAAIGRMCGFNGSRAAGVYRRAVRRLRSAAVSSGLERRPPRSPMAGVARRQANARTGAWRRAR